MPLTPSTRLGPYEILAPLGAGGMGEVYRARDTRLDRDVAIKALPEHLVGDPDRLARLLREAKALASLNHPGIAAIYGLEEADGRRYLVLECVEGQTLAQRLGLGAVGVEEALDTGRQVAEALETAHEKGVIHRDIKPGNVMLTPEGKVKVLDFGLARSIDGLVSNSGTNFRPDSPTMTSPAYVHSPTIPGVILGSAGYMSPEQARGKPVDKRSDIFSFGCVLYECLTGKRPFDGESTGDIIAKTLEREPDYTLLPPQTPMRVRDLLKQMLEKNPKRRLRDIGDAAIVLDRSIADREWALPGGAPQLQRASRRWGVPGILLAAAALTAALLVGWFGGRATPTMKPLLAGATFTKLTDQAGIERFPSLSPDGKNLIYAGQEFGQWDIYGLRVGGLNPVNLTRGSTPDDTEPAFSPDGTRIVFRSERDGGGLFVMGATGESPRRLTDFGFNPAWSPDGRFVVFSSEDCEHPFSVDGIPAVWTVDVDNGDLKKITDVGAQQPSWSPNGRRIAYWGVRSGSGQRDLYTIPVEGGTALPLTDDSATDWNPVWSADGQYMYFSSDRSGAMNVWRVAIDQTTGERKGEFEPVTAGVGAASHLVTIATGAKRLAYASQTEHGNLYRVAFDPKSGVIQGEPAAVTHLMSSFGYARVSPDGEWIACSSFGKHEDILLLRVDGSERRQLTNDAAKDRGPRWTPDGKGLIFYSDRSGKYEIWGIQTDGSQLRKVTDFPRSSIVLPVLSPDGRRIATGSHLGALLIFDAGKGGGDQAPERHELPEWISAFDPRSWSADGMTIAGSAIFNDRPEGIVLFRIAEGKFEQIVDKGLDMTWLQDNRHLIFSRAHAIFLFDVHSKEIKELMNIAPDRIGHFSISLGPGDSAILFPRLTRESDIWLIDWQ